MRKLFALITTTALLMSACGDDNSSSANDNELSSSSEEISINSSSDNESVSSSSEKYDEPNSSSSVQEENSSSDKAESSSSNNQAIPDFGDDKIVIKQIPTFGELDGKPYFYTTQPRCIYKNNIFSIKADTSDNAYFYEIANDTLTLYHVDLDKVLAGSYEEPSAKETYYGKNTSLENEWERLCYYNQNDDYSSCTQKYSYLISRDTIYNILTYPIDYGYEMFSIIEKVSHKALGIYDEMSAAEIAAKYAENGISIDSSNAKILISIKDKGTASIDEMGSSFINKEELSGHVIVSAGDKKCSYTATLNQNPIKYCSEEYLPYLHIDFFDGYVYAYSIHNQEEFDACLESLLD